MNGPDLLERARHELAIHEQRRAIERAQRENARRLAALESALAEAQRASRFAILAFLLAVASGALNLLACPNASIALLGAEGFCLGMSGTGAWRSWRLYRESRR